MIEVNNILMNVSRVKGFKMEHNVCSKTYGNQTSWNKPSSGHLG